MTEPLIANVESLVVTIFTIGVGYFSLMFSYLRREFLDYDKLENFFKIRSDDKVIVTIILGSIITGFNVFIYSRPGYTGNYSVLDILLKHPSAFIFGEISILIFMSFIVCAIMIIYDLYKKL